MAFRTARTSVVRGRPPCRGVRQQRFDLLSASEWMRTFQTPSECVGDLSLIGELAALTTVDRSIAISSAGLHFSHANAKESVSIAVSMIGFATFSASWPFANITTPDFLAGSAITKALKTPLSPQCQSMTPLFSR
jgi:hypothetical protein